MRQQIGFVLVLILSIGSVTAAEVSLKTADNVRAQLSLENLEIDSDFRVAAGGDAGIYYVSNGTKHYICGKPADLQGDNKNYTGRWRMYGRTITIAVTPKENQYELSFRAEPDDDITGWGISVAAEEDEYFTGLMERVVDGDQDNSWRPGITEAMNLRGQTVEMKVQHTVALYAPFFISSRGYGLFTHGTGIGSYTFPPQGKKGAISIFFEGPSCRFTHYTGGVEQAVRSHLMDTGPQVLPPKWAFRPFRWRDDHVHRETYYDGSNVNAPYNSEVVEDVLMMEALGIPCGVYWLDRPWGKNKTSIFGYDDLEYDQERFPETRKMIQWLSKRDIRMLLWICNWAVGPQMEAEAFKNGYAITVPDVEPDRGNKQNFIDFTNPKAVAWWKGYIRKVLKDGVAGFKMDRSEERTRYLYESDKTVHNGQTGRQVYNDYSHLYAKAANEVCREVRGDDFIIMPRAAYTNSARYAGFWGGDTYGNEWGLRSAIVAGLKASVIGYPIWGSDTGGYQYFDETTGEKSFVPKAGCRWLAYSCFCPIMEVGPTFNKGPWEIDDTLTSIWRMYAIVHDNLTDYTYQCAKEAHKTGMPVMRPLFLVYPEQQQAWDNWQTYLYGSDILVSPVWQDDDTVTQKVYLPKGEQWIDAWDTSKVLKGGQTVTVKCPLHKIPIYIRKGSSIDLGDLNKLWAESVKIVKNKPTMAELEKRAGFID